MDSARQYAEFYCFFNIYFDDMLSFVNGLFHDTWRAVLFVSVYFFGMCSIKCLACAVVFS